MGVDTETASAWIRGQSDDSVGEPVEILPWNRPAWAVFIASCNQWRTGGIGGLMGLDLVAVNVAAEALGIALDEDVLARLRIVETEALERMRTG